ncbi:FG-GAP-like repeat-containing protein [Candidatus Nitrospira neomarina]|uniref:FG-GAP-like repeat-containing protein n=1 Tax=Candidatus Nitrospira neomarina TaxID=3020899 RepID=A0AA96GHD3_9BACT|nr:FG-GAP-like repeat-containing protein [Candidatus Nitrospira neomarina]WNM60310.1 FG-GAP-like repeat-containing protein [Candidatus Nitrospira neomarina]
MKKIVLVSLGCLLSVLVASVVPAIAAVVRQPYLQLVTPTSITIVWRTDLNSADNSQVKYGTVSGSLTQTATGTAVTRAGLNVKDHIVTITGLAAATKYFYNVGTAPNVVQAGGTTNHFFVTAPPIGSATPIRAWVLGDSGDAGVNQRNVRDAMLTETSANPPDIILHMGDMAYENGTDAEFTSKHFAIYQDILRQTPLWPTLGNHEVPNSTSSMGIGPYYEAHVLPSSGQAGGVASGTEAYYAFDYANVHFIVLDSMDSSRAPGSPMVTWLQNDLASTGQEWVIAFWHHPPYSKGHDSDNAADSGGRLVDMREKILPILEAGGVDLVFAGHSHAYERSYLLDGAYGYGTAPNFATPSFNTLQADGHILDAGNGNPSGTGAYQKSAGGVSHDGTVYVVAGHGGHDLDSTHPVHPVMAVLDVAYGSVLLDITGSSLTFRNLREGGDITDTVSIVKNSSGTIATHDFNIDGKSDLVWRNTSTGASAVWLMNGVNIANTGFPGGASLSWKIAGKGDLNGDGKSDLVWRNTNSGAVSVWFMNGTTITSTGFPPGAPLAWQIAGVGDLNGDGKADLVWRNTSSGAVAVWIMNGTTILSTGFPGTVPLDWVIKEVGDLNGDGKADLVWRKNSTGAVAVWLMNGAAITSTGFPSGGSLAWQIVGLGDVNGNGTDDIVWRHASSGAVAVWFMNGATITSTGFPGSVSLNWVIRQVGDFNGDGKADLVWHNTGSGTVAVWLMNGATITSTGYPATTSLDWQIQ